MDAFAQFRIIKALLITWNIVYLIFIFPTHYMIANIIFLQLLRIMGFIEWGNWGINWMYLLLNQRSLGFC